MADVIKPLTTAANLLIVVGIGYTTYTAYSFFAYGPESSATVVPVPRTEQVRERTVSIERITDMHLFGRPPAGASASSAASAANLVETRLSLVLVGVFVADAADSSIAIIAQRGRPGKLYRIEDRLPGNAKLVEVYRDFVVIRRGGTREQLRFDQSDEYIRPVRVAQHDTAGGRSVPSAGAGTPVPAASASVASVEAAPKPSRARMALARYREDFEREPERILAEIGLDRPTGAGEAGYAIGALADRPELSQYGLQRGDRIVAVNGRPVGDPKVDRLQFDDLVAQGSASLEIQRGERRFIVTFSLD